MPHATQDADEVELFPLPGDDTPSPTVVMGAGERVRYEVGEEVGGDK